ncbi:MAG TPA: hypothetical protein VH207_01410 [Chthoniobacterales bacterium]|jgi:hypothetical protein|nr:hypothetical protein [Chthoniobacterales bacterium]
MKTNMRRKLAQQPFEEKIYQVGQLLQLSAKLKSQRGANDLAFTARRLRLRENATRGVFADERQLGIRRDPLIISAIKRKAVLTFRYNGKQRTVEPQTYGLSTAGREVLRACERSVAKSSKPSGMAKLFDVAKTSELQETGLRFPQALPAHNPDDSAMTEIFATLPRQRRFSRPDVMAACNVTFRMGNELWGGSIPEGGAEIFSEA